MKAECNSDRVKMKGILQKPIKEFSIVFQRQKLKVNVKKVR